MEWVRRLVDQYASMGLEGLPESLKSKRYAFSVICLFGTLVAICFALFYASYDFEGLRNAWFASIVCVSVIFLPFVAKYSLRVALFIGIGVVIWVFSYLTYHLGADSGLYLFINTGLLALLLANGKDNLPDTLLMSALAIIAMVGNSILFQEPSGDARIDPELQKAIFISVIILLSLLILLGTLVLATRTANAEAALAVEHERSEELLKNLLPDQIAARLKSAPGEVIADDLADVTILFADIANFTPWAASERPEEVVKFLNGVFTEFDILTDQTGLEKIKTIGDAYMVASGVPQAREDHAHAAADLALAMLGATARLADKLGKQVQLRIGLHSGPAIAGVIGSQKVFYDVWGDTVNTASRLESQGEIGRIQVTEDVKNMLGSSYEFEPRGLVDFKGKGPINTYWLVGKV